MNISIFLFSPTKTTHTVVRAMTSQLQQHHITETNWTHSDNCELAPETNLVILAVPVYSGLAPVTVIERIKSLRGKQTPIVLISVYGNRGADTATRELYEITSRNGFIPIAAAEFIGEHSYSTPTHPIAVGRPDRDDLLLAQEFGNSVMASLENDTTQPLTSEDFDQSPHRERNPLQFETPTKDLAKCTHCGKCEPVCPQNIWPLGNDQQKGTCIGCCACIKVCNDDALTPPQKIREFTVKLNQLCQERKEPNLIRSKEV